MSPAAVPLSLQERHPRALVICRSDVGDLVCATPLITALRERYPGGYLAAFVDIRNAAVLLGNPAVDAVYAFENGVRGVHKRSIVSAYLDRLRLIMSLRKQRFDYAILATPGFESRSLRLARMIGARHALGYAEPDKNHPRVDIALLYDRATVAHEVERVFTLLRALGVNGPPPPARVFPDAGERREIEQVLARFGQGKPVVGVHISAKTVKHQWPAESFAALIRAIAERHAARFLLIWHPGEPENPRHPGDDGKARSVMESCKGIPLLPCPTAAVSRLIAALSLCDYVVCADGGALHVAAALDKPILCFFGDSPPERWRPWKAVHELVQPASRDVKDLSVVQAMAGFERLWRARPFPQVS